jgi:hypothetical protein
MSWHPLRDLPEKARKNLETVLADPARAAGRLFTDQQPKRAEAACGTRAGYERHRRLKEPTCGACKAAERERWRQRRAAASGTDTAGERTVRCGTASGYERHRRRHEAACLECRVAKTEAVKSSPSYKWAATK